MYSNKQLSLTVFVITIPLYLSDAIDITKYSGYYTYILTQMITCKIINNFYAII